MPDALALALALAALAGAMITAVARAPWLPEAAVAAVGAAVLVIVGASSVDAAREALTGIGPTVGFSPSTRSAARSRPSGRCR